MMLFSPIISAQYTNITINQNTTDALEALQVFGALLGLGFLICLIVILINVLIIIVGAIWIYKDANKRGKEGLIWAIILILFSLILCIIGLGIVGVIVILIIWLVVRPPIGGEKKENTQIRRCPKCGRPIPMDAKVCPYCTHKFEK